jgi:hypothetical protein
MHDYSSHLYTQVLKQNQRRAFKYRVQPKLSPLNVLGDNRDELNDKDDVMIVIY